MAKYKVLSQEGNIMFFYWHSDDEPKNSEVVKKYGVHLATYFPRIDEWYKTKVPVNEYRYID